MGFGGVKRTLRLNPHLIRRDGRDNFPCIPSGGWNLLLRPWRRWSLRNIFAWRMRPLSCCPGNLPRSIRGTEPEACSQRGLLWAAVPTSVGVLPSRRLTCQWESNPSRAYYRRGGQERNEATWHVNDRWATSGTAPASWDSENCGGSSRVLRKTYSISS